MMNLPADRSFKYIYMYYMYMYVGVWYGNPTCALNSTLIGMYKPNVLGFHTLMRQNFFRIHVSFWIFAYTLFHDEIYAHLVHQAPRTLGRPCHYFNVFSFKELLYPFCCVTWSVVLHEHSGLFG